MFSYFSVCFSSDLLMNFFFFTGEIPFDWFHSHVMVGPVVDKARPLKLEKKKKTESNSHGCYAQSDVNEW